MALTTFFDHLTSVDSSRWGTLTSGSGSVTQTGSRVEIRTPSTTDGAAIYLNDTIDITQSQMIAICMSWSSSVANPCIMLMNKSSAPTIDTQANQFARGLFMVSSSVGASTGAVGFKWDNTGTLLTWHTSAATWGSGGTRYSIEPITAGDSWIVVFENDGPNSQWRFHGYIIKSSSFGDGKTQGLVHVCTSDWTAWSATRSVTDSVYLVIGDPINNAGATGVDVEWVRTGAAAKEYFALNGKDDGGSYSIRSFHAFDGKFLLPKDRSSGMLSGDVKDPCLVDGGSGTYYLFYRDIANTSVRVATGSSPDGSFTYSTTLKSDSGSLSYHFPYVVYTPWEGSGYEWQCLVEEVDTSSGIRIELRLLTCSTATGTWTDRGVVLTYGSGTDKDAHGLISPCILHRSGRYEVWYSGFYDPGVSMNGTETTVSGMRATGVGLTSAGGGLLALVKDGAGARLPYTDVQTALTANLTGRTASLTSGTGFGDADMPVFFDQDTTDNNWVLARAKSLSGTSLSLYSTVTGLTTASGATAFGPLSGPQNIRAIKQQANGDWHVYITVCQITKFNTTIGAVFAEFNFLLIVPAGTDLLNMSTSMYSWIDCPTPYLNTFGFGHSAENLTLVNSALTRTYAARPPLRQSARFFRRSF